MSTEIRSWSSEKKAATKVYSYGRISTAFKQAKGRGLKRQDEGALKWCEANGFKLQSENCFVDRGVSGFKKGRNNLSCGELRAILHMIEEGQMPAGSILIVESLDRLSRQEINIAVQLLLQIINAGIIVVTLIDNAVYRADANPHELMASLMMSVAIFMRANDESRTKSMRKADSWEKKIEHAVKTGTYHGGKLPFWLKVAADGKYEVIEKEADKVREFFKLYNGGNGLHVLGKHFGLNKSTLSYWLYSKICIGTFTVKQKGGSVEHPGHYPAIIDIPTYKLALEKKSERYRYRGRSNPTYINLFQHLLYNPNGETFIIQMPDGYQRKYVSNGLCLQVEHIEQHLIQNHLYHSLVEKRIVTEDTPEEGDRLKELEAKMEEVKAAMKADRSIFVDLLDVLKDVRREHDELKAKSKRVIFEQSDYGSVENATATGSMTDNAERRTRLREMIRDTVVRIDVQKVLGIQRRLVIGTIQFTTGEKRSFRYAFDTRRTGIVSCDGRGVDPRSSKIMTNVEKIVPLILDVYDVTAEVLAELAKLPLKPEPTDVDDRRKKDRKRYERRKAEKLKTGHIKKAA